MALSRATNINNLNLIRNMILIKIRWIKILLLNKTDSQNKVRLILAVLYMFCSHSNRISLFNTRSLVITVVSLLDIRKNSFLLHPIILLQTLIIKILWVFAKKCKSDPYSFLTIDITLPADHPFITCW